MEMSLRHEHKQILDIQWFDVECGIYFTSETGFFIFSRVQSTSEIMEKKNCLSSEINSIFSVKSIEFSVYYIFFGLLTCFFQILDTACNAGRDATKTCYFHTENIILICYCENNSLWNKVSLLFNG